MQILLISDTHGHLDIINQLIEKTRCDAVIHAGDFGFNDEESCNNLSNRELKLHIVYSDLSDEEKKKLLTSSPETLKDFIVNNLPLGDLPAYIRNEKEFHVPVYAV
ncbi:metallophosphoesterase family protein [Planctomycetota bacterium]